MADFLGCIDSNENDCISTINEDISTPVFNQNWFSPNIPQWNNYKALFYNKEDVHCLEIGAWKGRSTIYMAENYCNGDGSYVDTVDTWGGCLENSAQESEGLYERFMNNAKAYVDAQRINVYTGFSADLLMKFVQEIKTQTREKYDVIYIDGSHHGKDVLMDTVLAWEALKQGGVMLFDDYEWNLHPENPNVMQPKAAIDGFLKVYAGMYTLLHKGYQVHIQKTADIPY